jgi:hypothetical protein
MHLARGSQNVPTCNGNICRKTKHTAASLGRFFGAGDFRKPDGQTLACSDNSIGIKIYH